MVEAHFTVGPEFFLHAITSVPVLESTKPPILTNAGFLFSEVKQLELEAEYSPLSRAKFEKAGGATESPCKASLRLFCGTANILPLFFGKVQSRKLSLT